MGFQARVQQGPHRRQDRRTVWTAGAVLAGWLVLPVGAIAAPEAEPKMPDVAATQPVDEVLSCLRSNLPKQTTMQRVKITRVDRVGQEAIQQGRIEAKKMDEGERRVKICLTQPPDVRGSQVLAVERPQSEEAPDVFYYSPSLRETRRIVADNMSATVLATDISYEDFTRWQQVDRPEEFVRLDDSTVSDRAVYVLESRPRADAGSRYERVVSFVDKETCVSLKVESYAKGDQLTTLMVADPGRVERRGEAWVPMELEWKDVLDETRTELLVETVEVDEKIDDREFFPSDLGRYCR